MNLKELTGTLYTEGVEKGKKEAAGIISQAEAQAAAIVAKANEEAASITEKAEAKARELDMNTRSELKMYAAQAVQALKTEITDLINGEIVHENIKAATADPAFMQGVIANLAAEMAKDGDVVIRAKDAEALKQFYAANAKAQLDKGVKIEEVKGIKTDFTIQPAKGGYKLAFGDAELEAYFKEFLREDLIKLLFE